MLPETAIAAYESLVSLSNLLDNVHDRFEIQYPPLDAQPFYTLGLIVAFFLNQLHAHSEIKSDKVKQLWWDIATSAHMADDIIDAHVVDLLHQGERYTGHSTFWERMDRLVKCFHEIKGDLLVAIEEEGENTTDAEEREEAHQEETADIQKEDKEGGDTQGGNVPAKESSSAGHASSATSSHANVVGLDDKLIEIKDQLTSREPNLQIITITGMGGIGKTTLAQTVYHAPFAADHFDVCLWVAVSQNYVREKVLQGLLDSGEKKFFRGGLGASENHGKSGESLSDLGVKLYQGLIGRRYLVLLDDVWSMEVWDDLHWFFPEDENGSRILITTRDSIVASSLSSDLNINRLDFLDIDNSWKLLCQKVFPQGDDPIPELEEVGKDIAIGCKGLPLSIVVIGSMLAASPMTREYWEFVAKDVNSFRNLKDDGHCLEVLSLSFNSLPIHLKACFIHMSQYVNTSQISIKGLFDDWIAMGLIYPIQRMSKVSVAKKYLRTLVGRNLILIHEYYSDGSVSKCGLHDVLRDLGEKECRKNQFIITYKAFH